MIDRTVGVKTGEFLGQLAMASRERLEAMNLEATARHYGMKVETVRAYRDLQLGR